jgi:NADP-reducing hydrogenase subunit HndB
MAKLTYEDLERIRDQAGKSMALRLGEADTFVTVHMGTCGIAAGAREVMKALLEAVSVSGRSGIQVFASGCMGQCATEPNVSVTLAGSQPIVYQQMNAEKMKQVFQGHVLGGRVQTEFVLA